MLLHGGGERGGLGGHLVFKGRDGDAGGHRFFVHEISDSLRLLNGHILAAFHGVFFPTDGLFAAID